jgi:3-hydroxybutyryl-CoA dehydratase
MMTKYQPRGKYFEEFEVGKKFYSTSRTITESDIVQFAGLSGDYNQIHTDVEFSKSTPIGQRMAHGLLVTSVASGLIAQSGFIEGTVIAFREISSWKFTRPTFIGDTVHAIAEIFETKPMRRLGGGLVIINVTVLNQNDDIVMKGKWTCLMAGKPE